MYQKLEQEQMETPGILLLWLVVDFMLPGKIIFIKDDGWFGTSQLHILCKLLRDLISYYDNGCCLIGLLLQVLSIQFPQTLICIFMCINGQPAPIHTVHIGYVENRRPKKDKERLSPVCFQ